MKTLPRGRKIPLMAVGLIITLFGVLLAHFVQTAGGIRIQDVRFTGSNGTPMSAHLYIPPNATKEKPAPGILAVHGYFNSREAQSGFAIEFARRGYVVLALDQTGHGYSAPPAFANAFGGPDGLRYLRSLDFVDKENIGLEGHSMGGWTVMNAAAALPDGYKSIVLEGSSTGKPFAPEGSTRFPRNLAVVFSKYDEFSGVMWNVPTATQVNQSKKLQAVFGVDGSVETGRVYGSIEDGSARVLYTPAITHPMDHISPTAIGHAIDWFQRTLKGGNPRPASDQTWYWKEAGTSIALIGFVVLILGLLEAFLGLPWFAQLRSEGTVQPSETASLAPRWWLFFCLSVALPAVTLLPFMRMGGALLPASATLPQAFTTEAVFWALLNAAIVLVFLLAAKRKLGPPVQPVRTLALALCVFGCAYGVAAAVQFLFNLDFRFWFVAFRPMSRWNVSAFPIYWALFAVFFTVVLHSLHTTLTPVAKTAAGQYAVAIAALAGGFVIFLATQYGLLLSTGHMVEFHMYDALRTIAAISFVPVMTFVAVASTFIFRRTNRTWPAAALCSLFVTWFMLVGQATQGA